MKAVPANGLRSISTSWIGIIRTLNLVPMR